MTAKARPRRLVLMTIGDDGDVPLVRQTHESFTAIPGVRCLSAAATASLVRGDQSPYSHVSLFEFDDVAARDAYHDHPIHRDAYAVLGPHLASVLVLDLN